MSEELYEPEPESAVAMLQIEAGVLRLCAAAQRSVPRGRLVFQARELGRSASLLRVP